MDFDRKSIWSLFTCSVFVSYVFFSCVFCCCCFCCSLFFVLFLFLPVLLLVPVFASVAFAFLPFLLCCSCCFGCFLLLSVQNVLRHALGKWSIFVGQRHSALVALSFVAFVDFCFYCCCQDALSIQAALPSSTSPLRVGITPRYFSCFLYLFLLREALRTSPPSR